MQPNSTKSRAAPTVQQLWMPYAQAARQYLGISEDVLRAAINAGQLAAYEKPLTCGRKPGAARENHSYFVYLPDVDEYIRNHWQRPDCI